MITELNTQNSASLKITLKVKDYLQLMKFTLSFTVVFSCVICYLLAPDIIAFNLKMILLLFIAGMLVTGSANAINQAVEKDTDALMKRTAKRPVASGRMSLQQAYNFALITGIAGVFMMYYFFNFESAFLSALSLFLYAFIYTPLKKVSAVSVLVGAFPGALPCLIGWVAGFPNNEIIWTGGLVLFAIQFFWQFPHFWAIAWVAHGDYTKAGFKLLPSDKGPTKFTALQAVLYAMIMIPVGMLPYYFSISDEISFWIVLACNIFIVIQCVRLYFEMNVKAARRVMFSSYIYLPIVFLVLLADKIR
ncbi:MAG: heme o synthase [Chitinophagaceae bacterium]